MKIQRKSGKKKTKNSKKKSKNSQDFQKIWKSYFSEKTHKKNTRKNKRKSKKRSFFGIKNVKNFESEIQFFFSQKFFNPPMRPKRQFALKDTFPIETIVKKKNAKIPKISKNVLSYFSKKKIEKKNGKKNISRRLRRLGIFFFFGACGASFFFFFL